MSGAGGAVPFWRAVGMKYITYSNICANLIRKCLKEPFKAESINREKVHFSVSKLIDWKPDKPRKSFIQSENEWFFFSPRGRKYPNGSQSNATMCTWEHILMDQPLHLMTLRSPPILIMIYLLQSWEVSCRME